MQTQGKMRAAPTYRSLGAPHATYMSGNMRTYTSGGVVWGDAPPPTEPGPPDQTENVVPVDKKHAY